MAHLSDGTLRRMYDEPVAVAATAREHFNGCARCQDRFAAVAAAAREVQAAMSVPAVAVDARAAYAAVAARRAPTRFGWLRGAGRHSRPLLLGGLAAVLVAAVAGTAIALNMVTVFAPTRTQPLVITQASLQGFPDLSKWGDVKVTTQPELKEEATAAEAAHDSGLSPLAPKTLPAGLPAAQYAVVTQGSGSFTFNRTKADAAAAAAGSKTPPLPAGLDGSTLQLTAGPGEVVVYGSIDPKALQSGNLPQLVVGAAKAPSVTSSGATVKQIEDAVLAQPGVSPELAAEVRAIGDPTTTLPIPVPADKIDSAQITLNDGRTPATFLGDKNSKIYAAVVFIRNGVVYAVAGSYDQKTLVDIASSL